MNWETYSYTDGQLELSESGIDFEFNDLHAKFAKHTWVTFDLQKVLTQLHEAGLNVPHLRFIDLLTESKMILLSYLNAESKPKQFSLEYISSEFGIEPNHQILVDIFRKITHKHEMCCSEYDIQQMLLRAEFVKATATLEYQSAGFPVNTEMLQTITKHRIAFIRFLQNAVNHEYGPLFVEKCSSLPMTFSNKGFEAFVSQKGYQWPLSDYEGILSLQSDVLKEQVRRYPELSLLYQTLKTLKSMHSTNLDALEVNGYIKPKSEIFNQKTGRTSPLPTKGCLLNLPAWMRSLIKPKAGKVLIEVDWSQQEVAIAAALSGDSQYMAVYNSGDVYLALAKMAGAVPDNATKSSHSLMRQTFKAVQLGLGYGKGIASLTKDVFAANRDPDGHYLMTLDEANETAINIMDWHKNTFCDYWGWLSETIEQAKAYGYLMSVDGWTYFISDTTRDTQLLNFPMQANGAAMLRRAVIHAAKRNSFDLVCTLHDALYVNADESQTDFIKSEIVECMNQACYDILQGKIHIRTDVSVYTADSGYYDERGDEVLKHFHNFVRMNCSKP